MKTCPICKTQVFDDMNLCFGCMHSFARDHEEESPSSAADLPPSSLLYENRFETNSEIQRRSDRTVMEAQTDQGNGRIEKEKRAQHASSLSAGRVVSPAQPQNEISSMRVRMEVSFASDPGRIWSAEFPSNSWVSSGATDYVSPSLSSR